MGNFASRVHISAVFDLYITKNHTRGSNNIAVKIAANTKVFLNQWAIVKMLPQETD